MIDFSCSGIAFGEDTSYMIHSNHEIGPIIKLLSFKSHIVSRGKA